MKNTIVDILKMDTPKELEVSGWIKSFRGNRFIDLNDGSCLASLQIVLESEEFTKELLTDLNNGSSIKVKGQLIDSLGIGQKVELHAKEIIILGKCSQEDLQKTILQPKKHSLEKLREQGHLRFRTNLFGAVFRIRHHLAFAIHKYFNDHGFFYIHTPIITGTDAEGAGETFKVTTLSFDDKNMGKTKDFFGKPTHLTVSGQLEAELAALSLGKVYTFGPTFRAENSNTKRHLAEFWMVEPEVAFADIKEDVDLGEDFLKYLINYVLKSCKEDLQFLNDREIKEEAQLPKEKRNKLSLLQRMEMVINNKFIRITYTEAIDILLRSKPHKKKKFKYDIKWGVDLQSEHEKYLVEKHFQKPVVIIDYPKEIKAFYMRNNEDGKTVAAMDILFPGIGEIVGGSQREERYEVLEKKCAEFNVPKESIWWYLETRKLGTVPHAGFGLGFERLMMFVTGMENIRDVIPFPRTPNNAEF